MNTSKSFEQAINFYHKNQFFQAEQLFNQIIEKDPNHHQSINMLGVIANINKNMELAFDYIQSAIDLDSNNSIYYNNLGIAYLVTQDFQAAVKAFEKAKEFDSSNSEILCSLGYSHYRLGAFDLAKSALEEAISFDQNNVRAYRYGALLLRDMNDYGQALSFYHKILEIEPERPDIFSQMADVYFEQGSLQKAYQFYMEAIRLDPSLADSKALKINLKRIFAALFPQARFSQLNDQAKVKAFGKIINEVVSAGGSILEYSQAEGFWAIKAAQLGGKDVTLCNPNPFLINQTKSLVSSAGIETPICYLEKEPSDLMSEDISEEKDLLIVDSFSGQLPTFSDLLTLQKLKTDFLKPQGKVIPSNLSIKIMPIQSEELWREACVDLVEGVNISSLCELRSLYIRESLALYEHDVIAAPREAFHFELGATPEKNRKEDLNFRVETDGVCHAVVFWVDSFLEGDICLSESPFHKGKKKQYFHVLDKPVDVEIGQTLEIHVDYGDIILFEVNVV